MIHKMHYVHGSKLSFMLYPLHKAFASIASPQQMTLRVNLSMSLNDLGAWPLAWHENLLLLLVFVFA